MQKNIANFLTLLGCLGLGFTLTKTSYASIIVFNFAEIKNIQKSDYDSTLSKTLFAESRQMTFQLIKAKQSTITQGLFTWNIFFKAATISQEHNHSLSLCQRNSNLLNLVTH